jgi:hypothetical protein
MGTIIGAVSFWVLLAVSERTDAVQGARDEQPLASGVVSRRQREGQSAAADLYE